MLNSPVTSARWLSLLGITSLFVEGAEGGDQSLTGDLFQEARLLLKSAKWNRQASDAKQERDLNSGSPALFSLHDDCERRRQRVCEREGPSSGMAWSPR